VVLQINHLARELGIPNAISVEAVVTAEGIRGECAGRIPNISRPVPKPGFVADYVRRNRAANVTRYRGVIFLRLLAPDALRESDYVGAGPPQPGEQGSH